MDEPKALPCSDKLAFDSEQQAKAEAAVVKWRRGTKLRVYKCRYCDLWHLSST